MEEYLRLPRGMRDRDSVWNEHKNTILNLHNMCGKKIGSDVMSYSYVSFKSTFTKECNITNNKVYEFQDKSGRNLVLTCDSTASILREYSSDPLFQPRRVSFVSPIFRYWSDSSRNRFFTQLGYCIINAGNTNDSKIIHLLEIAYAMSELLNKLGIETTVFLNDYSALKKIFQRYIGRTHLKEFIYRFQFSSKEQRIKIIAETIEDTELKKKMMDLFSGEPQEINPAYSSKRNELFLPTEYLGIYDFAKNIHNLCDKKVFFCPSDLHCIEMMDSFTIRFMKDNSYAIAEGGDYSTYAEKFNSNIHSFLSVCSGIEPLERNVFWKDNNDCKNCIAIFQYGASLDFIINIFKLLSDTEYVPCFIGEVKNVKQAISCAKKRYTKLIIAGEREETTGRIIIKDLLDGSEKVMQINSDLV